MLPRAADVIAAGHRLRSRVVRTPLVHSPALSARTGVRVFLKCENLQRTGSFKLRGATNALLALDDDARRLGVVASSAGNHGLGLADAARALGVRARIFVPSTAPEVKRNGIAALGAELDVTAPHYDAAHDAAVAYASAHGMTFVNPCAGRALLAGQGTVALEILEELPTLRTILVPVGGGGLVGGVAALLRAASPMVRIIGVQSAATNAMAASFAAGRRVDVATPPTLADGLTGQIDDEGFAIGRLAIDEMVVVSEPEVASAVAWLAREHDLRVEGSGAVVVAALRASSLASLEGEVAAVLSGGNIDEGRWREIVASA